MGSEQAVAAVPVAAEGGLQILEDARGMVDRALIQAGLPPAGVSAAEVARMRGIAADIHGSFGLLNDEEPRILGALRGRSPTEINALRAAYRQMYGADLDATLGEKLGGQDEDVARFLMQGERRVAPRRRVEEPDAAARARADAAAIFAEVDNVFSDEAAITRVLAGKSAGEAALLRDEYRRHYGRELDGDLDEALDEDEMEVARAHLTGDRGRAAAIAILDDPDVALETLRRLGPVEQAGLMVELALRGGGTLETFLAANLDEDELDEARALVSGDRARADAEALRRAIEGAGTTEGLVDQMLEAPRTPEQRCELLAEYARLTGRSLDEDLEGDYSGFEERRVRALASGDAGGAAAARLEAMTVPGDVEPEHIVAALEGMAPDVRPAALAAFARDRGMSLQELTDAVADPADAEAIRQASQRGALDPAFGLYWSVEGIGTKEGRIQQTLEGQSQQEAAVTARRYQEATGESLIGAIEGDLDGRDEDHALLAARGRPATVEEAIARADADWDIERGSGAGILGGVTDWFYDGGEMMDRQHARLQGVVSEEEAGELIAWQGVDQQLFQSEQARVASAAENVARVGATLALITATGGGAAPGLLTGMLSRVGSSVGLSAPSSALVAADLAGGLAAMGARRAIEGSGYGIESFGADAAMTGASMISAGVMTSDAVTRTLPDLVAKLGASPMVRDMGVQALSGVAGAVAPALTQGLVDERTWEDGGDDNFAALVGTGLFGAGLGGAMTARLERAMWNEAKGLPRAWRAFLQGSGGNLAGGLAQQALQPGVTDGEAGEVAVRLLAGAAPGAIQGGLAHMQRARRMSSFPPRTAVLSGAAATTPNPGPPGEVVARVAARRAELRDVVDAALADPARSAILRRDGEAVLLSKLTQERGEELEPELRRLHPEMGSEAFHELLRERSAGDAKRRLEAMPAVEAQGRLRRTLYDETDARAAHEVNRAMLAELAEGNRAYGDETFGRGANSGLVPVDLATGKAVLSAAEKDDLKRGADRAAEAAPVVVDFAIVGAGLPAAADLATRQQAGDGRGLVVAEDFELWTRMVEMMAGQEAANVPIPGLTVQPADIAGDGAEGRYARASELALAATATMAAEGARILEGKIVTAEARPEGAALGWPADVSGRVLVERQVVVEGADGTARATVEQVWVYSKGKTDFAGGMGTSRPFKEVTGDPAQQAAALAALADGRMVSAERQLELMGELRGREIPAAVREGGVLVQAGSATGAWTASETGGAGLDVTWIARQSPPGDAAGALAPYAAVPDVGASVTRLGALDAEYKKAIARMRVKANAASAKGNPKGFLADKEGKALKKQLERITAARNDAAGEGLAALDKRIKDLPEGPQKLAMQRTRESVAGGLDPFAGAQVPRNFDLAGNPNVHMKVAEILTVEPAGEDRVRAYLSSGEVLERARFLTAIGQVNKIPELIAKSGKLSMLTDEAYKKTRREKAEKILARKIDKVTQETGAPTAEQKAQLAAEAEEQSAIDVGPPPEIYGLETPAFRVFGAGASPHTWPRQQDAPFATPADRENYLAAWRARSQSVTDPDSHGTTVGIRVAVHDRVIRANIEALKRVETSLAKGMREPGKTKKQRKRSRAELNRSVRMRKKLEGTLDVQTTRTR